MPMVVQKINQELTEEKQSLQGQIAAHQQNEAEQERQAFRPAEMVEWIAHQP